MQNVIRIVLTAIASTITASAFAALPDSGLWAIDTEVDGKPGRGFQIDRQGGETVIVSYYGYRADGSAVFYQAVGKITDGKSFSADLSEYKNGRAFTGNYQSAEYSGSVGTIKVVFDTAESGAITLPGTYAKPISRYSFEDTSRRLLASHFDYISIARKGPLAAKNSGYLYFSIEGNELLMFENSNSGLKCQYSGGTFEQKGDSFRSRGVVSCQGGKVPMTNIPYRLDQLKVDEIGVLTGNIYIDDAPVELQHRILVGECITGPRPGDDVIATNTPPDRCSPKDLGMTESK